MKLTLNDLTVSPGRIDLKTILSSWEWALKQPMDPVLITAMGNLFVQGEDESVHFIDAQHGTVGKVTDTGDEFESLLGDAAFVTHYFDPNDIGNFRNQGLQLGESQCYSYIKPLALGGEPTIENIEVSDFTVHFDMLGQIHEQIKDLPEGTDISDIKIN